MPAWLIRAYYRTIGPLVRLFVRVGLGPNALTTLGLVASVGAAWALLRGAFVAGGALLFLSGIFDTLDGPVARASGRTSPFGALYDSTLDRYAELLVFFGLGAWLVRRGFDAAAGVAALAAAGSVMVSYVRARAEGLGFDAKVGLLQRPERIVLLASAAVLTPLLHGPLAGLLGVAPVAVPPVPLMAVLGVVAVLGNATALHRLLHIWRATRPAAPSPEPGAPPSTAVPSTAAGDGAPAVAPPAPARP